MEEKRSIDRSGAIAMIAFATLMAVNQVVIKLTGAGFGPVFQAGLRSAIGVIVLVIWMRARGIRFGLPSGVLLWGIVNGLFFSFEFICLYLALDLTLVSRASIIFYSMPIWLALAAHLWLPGERLGGVRALGLGLAMAGVVLALMDRSGGQASLLGDILALFGALFWAAIALVLRLTSLSRAVPEMQLLVQVVVSVPVLLGLAPLFGDLLRDPGLAHVAGVLFQAVFIVAFSFLLWIRVMSIYRANAVASFSFLSPVLAVLLGWLVLDEQITLAIWLALGLVTGGVFLINKR